jgi:hypothetical protein
VVPDEVFALSTLKKLKGLLPHRQKKDLLQLLNTKLAASDKRGLFYFWIKERVVSNELLIRALAIPISTLQKRVVSQLLQNTQQDGVTLAPEVNEINILGRLTTSTKELGRLLTNASVSPAKESPYVILGRPPFVVLPANRPYHFFNEAQLLVFLRQKKQAQTPALSSEQKQRLEKLLLHSNSRQIKMGLLLLAQQKVNTSLIPALIAAWKLQADPGLKRRLAKLVQQNIHPAYEILRQSKLSFQGLDSQEQKAQQLAQWLAKAGLEIKDYTHWKDFL